jgi:hypothetical protein
MANAKVVTGKVRLSYCNLFEPRATNEGEDAKFSVSLLISKKDTATIKAIKDAIQSVIDTEKASKFGGKEKGFKLPLRDGDEERDAPEYEGHYFINASSKKRPVVLDEDRNVVLNPSEVYSGCYARASINFYAFAVNGNKGVAVALNSVMKVEDGEPLGGVYTEDSAKADFEDDDLM